MKYLILTISFLLNFSILSKAGEDSLSVKTIEGITDKMLELISGEIGEERDWDEFRKLFLPTAQFVSVNPKAKPNRQTRTMNLEEFIRNIGPLYSRDGFLEYSLGIEINEFNGVANAFQSFYCKNLTGTYEARGINNYMLIYADDRWWIAQSSFSNETDDSLIPKEYLTK